jgi:hypothetical protein
MPNYRDTVQVQSGDRLSSDKPLTKEDVKEVPDVAQALYKQQERLGDMATMLRDRLHSVLRKEDIDGEKCLGGKIRTAPLAVHLAEVGSITARTELILCDILDRLEL